MGHLHHSVDYVEFTVTSINQAKRFYSAAFGWSFTDYGPAYCGISIGGREFGGLTVAPDVRDGGPLVVLFSTDLDQTLTSVQDAGGRIVKPPFGFPGGRRFHFADPSGNTLAVWSDGAK